MVIPEDIDTIIRHQVQIMFIGFVDEIRAFPFNKSQPTVGISVD